jgi:hypothetical protein
VDFIAACRLFVACGPAAAWWWPVMAAWARPAVVAWLKPIWPTTTGPYKRAEGWAVRVANP